MAFSIDKGKIWIPMEDFWEFVYKYAPNVGDNEFHFGNVRFEETRQRSRRKNLRENHVVQIDTNLVCLGQGTCANSKHALGLKYRRLAQ